jgi:adenine-specific DNA glycosylase
MTDYKKPDLAPGCFGSALTFRPETPECKSCPFVEGCGPASEARWNHLSERFGIKTRLKANQRKKPILPQKVQELVERIRGMNISIDQLRLGKNPFEASTEFKAAKITCHLLIQFEAGVPRHSLSTALSRKFAWSEKTAEAQTLQISQALQHLGVVDEVDGVMRIRR